MLARKILKKLEIECKKDYYKGWDVFDGLNSNVLNKTLLFKLRLWRLFWIQIFKRLPINLRSLFLVPKGYNAKGLALFARGFINLYKIENNAEYLDTIYKLAEIIISQKSKTRKYFCVGYNFFWEARAFSVPAFTPNIIVSSFVGQLFLDMYGVDKNKKWLQYTKQICYFIEHELKLLEKENEICFGYIPGEKTIVHNANLMGADLFARLYKYTFVEKYKQYAIKSAQYSVNSQQNNGAWVYGKRKHHQWVDNFHTGFNLVALKNIQKNLGVNCWEYNIQKGLEYHLQYHFLADMTPKYYDTKLYPIDIHNFAQGIVAFLTFEEYEKAEKLFHKAVKLMWDKQKNYFYYQKNRLYKNKIKYLRWSQAWMFYALSKLNNRQ